MKAVDCSRWFVMRAYKCEKKAEEALEAEGGMDFFIPKKYAVRVYHGVKSKRLVPAIPGLVFVYATHDALVEFKKSHNFLQFIKNAASEYLVVPDSQMESFIKVASLYEENTVYHNPDEIDIKKGARVRIHGGKFDQVQGIFVKVRGKRSRRLVVMLDGLLAASVEVSPDLIEVLQ